jgi:putative redox protein
MGAELDIRYEGQFRCEAARKSTGQIVCTDVSADHGGRDEMFSPTELATAALGTCIMSMLAVVAERSGADISGAKINLVMEMASAPVRRIGSIKAKVNLPGAPESIRQKLEAAAGSCPVKSSFHPDVKISLEFDYGG